MALFHTVLASLRWDPSSDLIVLPVLGIPITWYGLLFALGFWAGFYIFSYMYTRFLTGFPDFREGDVNWKRWRLTKPAALVSLEEFSLDRCNALLEKDIIDKGLDPSEERLMAFSLRRFGSLNQVKLRRRLLLEKRYPDIFSPIRQRAKDFGERLILAVILATVLGARIAFILFYQDPMYYLMHPLSILKTWEGGLASHGGVAAIIITLYVFHRVARPKLQEFSFWDLVDYVALPTMLVASLIRVGNFFNQEILGVETRMPWGVVFGHPKDGSLVVARHPTQLYESFFYFAVFLTLCHLWYWHGKRFSKGKIVAIAIGFSFTFRFFVEFLKMRQTGWFDNSGTMLSMGQILSIPMALFGIGLFFYVSRKEKSVAVGSTVAEDS